ncbi:MAG: hypothetical protein HRU36_05650 [Rickettsiales bacterium]|nr:hypothetical protein [Rickettsiales bacterium]
MLCYTKQIFFALIFLWIALVPKDYIYACGNWYDPSTYFYTKSNTALPLDSTPAGAPNAFPNAKIKVNVSLCQAMNTNNCTSLILSSGDAKYACNDPVTSHTYLAQIETNKKVCDNMCAYAYNCTSEQKKLLPGSCDGYKGHAANCDPQLYSITYNMCQASLQDKSLEYPEAVGICAYKSDKSGFEQFIDELFSWESTIISSAVKASEDFYGGLVSGTIPTYSAPNHFSILDCYPVPTGNLPPPFCIGEMKIYSPLTILRICTDGETPVRTKSGFTQECVKPLSDMKSTFMHPCVRVTYNNPSKDTFTSNSASNYQNYYTTDWKEILYEYDSTQNIRYCEIYNDYTTGDSPLSIISPSPLKQIGYNDANYTDVCGDINEDGSITTLSPSSIVDQYNSDSPRSLKLQFQCIAEGSCTQTQKDILQQTQICVYEERGDTNILQGCVDRPEMDKPSVSFCDSTINDKDSSCMKITATTSSNTTESYKFQGSMNQCTDTPTTAEDSNNSFQLCTLNSQNTNPFGFQAILTNRCYINMSLTPQESSTKDISYANMCYQNSSSCAKPTTQGCQNCAIDEYCFTPYDNSKNTNGTATGVERLCLFRYTNTYTSVSPKWCKDSDNTQGCNRVCTTTQFDDTTKSYLSTPLLDITNRLDPTKTISSPLTSSCPYSNDIITSSSENYRVRNPVEEDLCVDVYTVYFNKECKNNSDGTAFSTEIAELCTNVRDYCSQLKDNSNNHYKNFDECQSAFKTCLTTTTPTESQKLGDDITYSCCDLLQIISDGNTSSNDNCPSDNSSSEDPVLIDDNITRTRDSTS